MIRYPYVFFEIANIIEDLNELVDIVGVE